METVYAKLPIGVFDSGMGGLSVLTKLLTLLPDYRFIYYADNLNAPYGNKTVEEIDKCVYTSCSELIERGVNILVLACNTATGTSIKKLRADYPDVKIFGIEPAIKPAALYASNHKTLVYCTLAASKQKNFLELTEKYKNISDIITIPQPHWAGLIEKNYENLSTISDIILSESRIPEFLDVKSIVLGCTHYYFIKDILSKAAPDAKIFDGSDGLAENVFTYLNGENLKKTSQNNNACDNSKRIAQDGRSKKQQNLLNKVIRINEGISRIKRVEFAFSGKYEYHYAWILTEQTL